MAKIYISSIVATAKNNVIGRNNGMIWHLPEDLKHFKKTTLGKPILMGRKSYESLGKPLPGRPNIVISRAYKNLSKNNPSKIYKDMEEDGANGQKINEGPFLYSTIEDGVKAAKDMARDMKVNEIFITGGGEIYKQTLEQTDRLYLTLIDKDYEGDAYFPAINWNEWNIISQDRRDGDPAFTFYVLEKK